MATTSHSLWEKFLPAILIQMKNAKNGSKEIRFLKTEFSNLGKKPVSELLFQFDIVNGRLQATGKKMTTFAQDLYEKLKEQAQVKGLMDNQHYHFHLGKDLVLKIDAKPMEVEAV